MNNRYRGRLTERNRQTLNMAVVGFFTNCGNGASFNNRRNRQ